MAAAATERTTLLDVIDEAFNRKSWHGTNLRGSIRGLSAEQAAWCQTPGRHTIADIVVHCAYWKYSVRRRLRGEKRGSFPLKGSEWFKLPAPVTEDAWAQYVTLLIDQHELLRESIAGMATKKLATTPPGSQTPFNMLIRGAALHDVYHAGQIQMIKGLYK